MRFLVRTKLFTLQDEVNILFRTEHYSNIKKARRFVYFTSMFIIDLQYIVPLEQLDAHMTEHVKFLQKYYKQNVFVASGRKVPRTGGIILALAKSREEVDEIIKEDPFYIHKLAEFKVTEFMTSQSHPEIKKLLKEF
jgi:uncharacterized protein YciI